MSLEKVAKKFLGEPFIWVCFAMTGVVLMGPAAANLARKAVGGDRNRGNVDEHGETINETAPLKQQVQTRASRNSLADASRNPLADASRKPLADPSRKQHTVDRHSFKKSDPGNGSSGRDLGSDRKSDVAVDKPKVDQTVKDHVKQESSFDVEEMVEDVKSEMNSKSADVETAVGSTRKKIQDGQDALAGSSTKRIAETQDALADNGDREIAQIPMLGAESGNTGDPLGGSLPSASDMTPLPPAGLPNTVFEPWLDESNQDQLPQISNDTDAVDYDLVQQSTKPERDSSTAIEILSDEQAPAFSPWDEPLTFKSGSDIKNEHVIQDQPVYMNQPLDMNQMPLGNMASSIQPESGGAWWDAQIAQQFWPEREAQFASIDSVVFIALQNSAQIQILNDRPRIEETFVQQREADFDWSAFVDASWNSIDEPVRSELQTGSRTGRFVQEELAVSSGLKKRLSRGGELRVGSSIGTVDNNSVFLAPPDQGTASFSLDYRQPLLRGRGREITQSQIVLARLNVESSQHSVRQQMQEYLVDVVTAYWDLYRARGVLSQRHKNHLRATEVVQRLSARSSTRARSQLQRAHAAASARRSEVIDAEYVVADAQERLMNLTHGDGVADSNTVEIIPTDATHHSSLPHDLEYITQLAVQNRAEVKEVLAEIKAASVRQVIALDGLKPKLDAIISSYVAGVRGNKDVGNAIVDQFSAGDPSYSVGMSFEIPIGRRSASAGMMREEIHRRVLENKLRKTLGEVSMSARSAFRDVYRLMAMAENNRQVVAQSAEALNVVQQDIAWLDKDDPSSALFLNDLLGSQDRLAEAEQNLLDSQARLAIAYVRLKRATGELLRDDANSCESGGCSTCGDTQCDDSNVTQANWQQPVEHMQTIIENGKDFTQDVGDRFQLPIEQQQFEQQQFEQQQFEQQQFEQQPAVETLDVPLQSPAAQPGVTPFPHDADTAGEIFSAPAARYPLSTQRPTDWVAPRY